MLLPFALLCFLLPLAVVSQTVALPQTISVFGRPIVQDNLTQITKMNNSYVIYPKIDLTGLQEIKIGVLLPFSQKEDNDTATIVWSGWSAIRMAVNQINQQRTIPGAYISLIQKDSFPGSQVNQDAVTEAVYASITLLQEGVVGVLGDVSSSWTTLSALMTSTLNIPQCSFTASQPAFSDKTQYRTFFRTIPTSAIVADAMLAFSAKQGWSRVGIITTDDMAGQQFYQRAITQTGSKDLRISHYQSFTSGADKSVLQDSIRNITSDTRIIMVAAMGSDMGQVLVAAAELGFMSNDYVWMTMDNIPYWVAYQNTTLDINSTFSGMFMFDNWMTLYGYQPYETFLDNWAQLDPLSYPFAGHRGTISYEGQAYSCMMVMAEGFNHLISNFTSNFTLGLSELINNTLTDNILTNYFNVGYVSPDGPMVYDANGDLVNGNYLVYNLQSGNSPAIGQMLNGVLTMTAPPIFHDGTSTPPPDMPPGTTLNPNWSSPIARAIMVVVLVGLLFSLVVFGIVVINRKHEVFKAASPLFCCLELIGFMLAYVATTFFVGVPTPASCIVSPVTLNLGFMLVLGNLIAKNYRIYRIFNNIFIARTVITDSQLIKSVLAVISVDMIILIIGLGVTKPTPVKIAVTPTSYYWSCHSDHSGTIVFLVLNTIYAAGMLLFATFLAYRTRLAGQQYGHYSECKQMGLSVYNILFSALVGFVITINPIADFYTKYYITVIAVLWATTFSLLILFLPKLHSFFQQWRRQHVKDKEQKQKEQESQQQHSLTPGSGGNHPQDVLYPPQNDDRPGHEADSLYSMFHPGTVGSQLRPEQNCPELLSLEQIIGSGTQFYQDRKPSSATCDIDGNGAKLMEVHQSEMPIRRVFRYFPVLSQWEMQHVMVFPMLGYFSHFSKRSNKGNVMSYTRASIHSVQLEDYVLKIHGKGMYDVYLQVPDLRSMEVWQQCFNHRRSTSQSFRRSIPMSAEVLRSLQQQASVPMSPSQDPLMARQTSESSIRVREDEEDTLSDETNHHPTNTTIPPRLAPGNLHAFTFYSTFTFFCVFFFVL